MAARRADDSPVFQLHRLVAAPKARFVYEYDFGDGWEHQVVVEKVLPVDPAVRYPICITGKRASPLEEVGGIRGYHDFLEAIASPEHPEHANKLDWIGGECDPEEFSVDEVNEQLREL
jgi:hypothetical protein